MNQTQVAALIAELNAMPAGLYSCDALGSVCDSYVAQWKVVELVEKHAAIAQQAQEPVGYLPSWAVGRLAGELGGAADPVSWGIHAPIMAADCPNHAAIYTTPPAPQPAPVDELIEFEAWARPNGYDMRRNDVLGHYSSIDTSRAWTGWQARAALQSPAPQAGGWLPIESAPKDGTRLILWWGGKPVFAGWLDNSQCKHPWAGWQTPSLTPRPQGEPTHYMPPPPAPQTKGQP